MNTSDEPRNGCMLSIRLTSGINADSQAQRKREQGCECYQSHKNSAGRTVNIAML